MNENELRENGIEKLACAVCKAVFNNGECGSCQHLLKSKVIARKLFDNGVRKIPDGAVVLQDDEYATIVRNAETAYEEGLKDARKETAREILNGLRGLLEGYMHTKENISLYEQYCQKYGVEVEE